MTDERLDCSGAGWFRDGTRVVMAAREPGRPARSFVVNAGGGKPEPITPEGVAGTLVSPDGAWLLAARAGEPIALYPVSGGAPRTIPRLEAEDEPVRWSEDGRSIYVRRDFQPENPDVIDIFRVDVTSGRRDHWKRIRPTEFARLPDLLPVSIGSDEQSYAYTFWRATSDLFLIEGLR